MSDDDGQPRFSLGSLFALTVLAVSVVVGSMVVKSVGSLEQPKPAAILVEGAAFTESVATMASDSASVRVEDGMVKFYFASGSAELAIGASEALVDVAKGVAEGKKAAVSGFHDATGDAAMNAELSKQRALAVRAALTALGITEDKIDLRKPESTIDSNDAEARRVEVVLVDM